MRSWLKSLFMDPEPIFIDLKTLSNKELVNLLKKENLSLVSGNRVVLQLLERLIER